jgi:hypothetical protein
MHGSKLVISSLVVAIGVGGARPASADREDIRLLDFINWTLRLISPPDPCTPPDPCHFKLQTDIAPRQHPDVNQIFIVGHHSDRAFEHEARFAIDPCSGPSCPPGPPQIGLRLDVLDPTNPVVVTVPAGYELQPIADASGATSYVLAPVGVNTLGPPQ